MAIHYLHTKLQVSDLDVAIRFYENAFGYALRSRRPGPQDSEIAFMRLPDEATEIQLCRYPDGEDVVVPERLMHLAFRVDDLEAVLAGALAAGASLESAPYTLPSGSHVAFIRDPQGYAIELIQKA
jgi:predicted enzyme related to lactoylglutathione lyase